MHSAQRCALCGAAAEIWLSSHQLAAESATIIISVVEHIGVDCDTNLLRCWCLFLRTYLASVQRLLIEGTPQSFHSFAVGL